MKIGQPADKPAATGGGSGRPEPTATVKTTMQIKVPPINGTAAAASAGATAAPAGAANGSSKTADVESSAKVQISRAATTLISPQKAVNGDIDADKVSKISQQIADNSYQVNAAAIADKLIANAQELLGKVPR